MLHPHEKIANDWYAALKTIDPEKKAQWIKYSLRPKKMLPVFGRYIFPHIVRGRTPLCHIELLDEITRPISSGIIFPRGFAKSTWEKIDTIHDIVYAIEPVILYISDTAESAGFHFESIKGELEGNEILRYVYGNLVPLENEELSGKARIARHFMKWTNKHFETANGVNVVSRGACNGRGVNIRNQRPTKIIVDDAETDEQVRSPIRRQQYHDWLYNVIIPSLDKERGRIKVIGTVIHPECEVLKFYNAHGGIFKKAIENVQNNEFRTGQSIWPDYMTMTFLIEKLEEIGTRAFMQEFMNEPTNAELAHIKIEWIDDNYYTVLPHDNRSRLQTVIALDPQSGEKSAADEYAITVLSWYAGDKHKYVVEQKAGRASQQQQAIEVINMWLKYPNAKSVGIESVLGQVAVFQLISEWRNGNMKLDVEKFDDRNIPITKITPGGKDKVARFQKFESMIERGELHLRPEMGALREQMLFLGTNTLDHDDRVDSLIMTLEMAYRNNVDTAQIFQEQSEPQETAAGNLFEEKY
jgi:phage terminase large subunit-like protein